MKGKYSGRNMTIYGYVLPGSVSLANWAAKGGGYLSGPGHRAGFVPIVRADKKFSQEIKEIGAKIYHLSGCYFGELQEIKDGRIVSHSPILAEDKHFRRYLKTILKNDPEVLVVEVDDPLKNGAQKESFENLCKYLLELL